VRTLSLEIKFGYVFQNYVTALIWHVKTLMSRDRTLAGVGRRRTFILLRLASLFLLQGLSESVPCLLYFLCRRKLRERRLVDDTDLCRPPIGSREQRMINHELPFGAQNLVRIVKIVGARCIIAMVWA
jgi:hypothetical protein